MGSMDRYRSRVAEYLDIPVQGEEEIEGVAPSFNLASQLRMPTLSSSPAQISVDPSLSAAPASTTSSTMASDAATAEALANEAERKAVAAGAEAQTELDAFGPLHREALNADRAAKAARAKANYYVPRTVQTSEPRYTAPAMVIGPAPSILPKILGAAAFLAGAGALAYFFVKRRRA
jgi:hypothetical protein